MARNKLKNRNVPETFYQRFLASLPATTTLLQKLEALKPTQRGRGYSRVLPLISDSEWNELYRYAAEGRAQMQGADRETTLRPAICARALAESMEGMGVDNPIVYTPKRKRSTVPAIPVLTDITDTDDTDLSSGSDVIPTNQPTVDQVANVDEANDDDLDSMHGELAIG